MARPANNPGYGKRTLQIDPACDGLDVWELQIKLLGWGSGMDNDGIGNILEPMKVTGTFDRRTRDAVMRFQKAVGLPVNGVVDSATFIAIDREPALYPVLVHLLKCPCTKGQNASASLCRCGKHPNAAVCAGFGKGDYNGNYLVDAHAPGDALVGAKKLGDGTDISGEKLDIYHMREFPGIDKAVIWAVRGLMRRAGVPRIAIHSGYRCWADNYHHYDDLRWHHRKQTFFLGHAIDFYHDGDAGACVDIGADPTKPPCGICAAIRDVAIKKCGFQLRWQEPDRVSVAEGLATARPPANPYGVHVNTVRRKDTVDADFVQTFLDSTLPLYAGVPTYAFPMDLGEGIDPKVATSDSVYTNNEKGPGGWYPLGASRIWHGGAHIHEAAGKDVHAMADGEIVGFRVGEKEDKKTLGSRNFVLMRHEFQTKKYYTLYYHLDGEQADKTASVRWRKQIFIRTVKHVEALAPCPFFKVVDILQPDGTTVHRFKPREQQGLGVGELAPTTGADADATTIDNTAPANSRVIKLSDPADTYVFTKLENKDLAKIVDAEKGLDSALKSHDPVGMANPFKVRGGEVIGKIGAVATDGDAARLGTFVHVEIFSDQAFISGDGWEQIDAGAAAKVPDRKEIVQTLMGKKLLSKAPDDVLLDQDIREPEQDVYRELARAVILKMPSEWELDWQTALRGPDCLTFIEDRGALGAKFNEYRWWADLKKKFALPGSTVFHYHPIAAVIHMAHT